MLFFFFFQAEDGIRDYKVTGVQTCALPICECVARPGACSAAGPGVARRHRRAALHAIGGQPVHDRSEEHTSELQSPCNLVCRLLLEKKKKKINNHSLLQSAKTTSAELTQSPKYRAH